VVVVLEAVNVVKEQVGQENDHTETAVKRIEFQNEQVFHEYWTVPLPKVWNDRRSKVTAARSQRRTKGLVEWLPSVMGKS